MNISEVCIKRPVFAWVLTLIVILLGLVTGDRLPVRQYPKMEKNYVTIKMTYHGAGPEIIESQITRTIEEAVAGIEGIDTITSKSDSETSEVSIEIAEGRDLDSATNDIRDRLSKWRDRFPEGAQEPILTKAGSNEKSIVSLALISKKLTESELYSYGQNEISHALESVPGVARIDVYGAGDYQISVKLDPQKMAFYNLTVLDVAHAIEKQNIESPAGKIINENREYVVTTLADLQSPEEFKEIPIATRSNTIVKLKDVANAQLTKSNKRVMSRFNGEKVVTLSVISQSSANPIQVARGIKEKFDELQSQIPEGTKFSIAYDSTTFIERSLHEVYRTLFEAIILVVLVVFVFLKSLRAALIPLVTVPISLIGALFIMYLCDFTINSMTLMSMVLAIGLVVDDAIVILENVYKYLERGYTPMKAALEGTKEVSFAVIAMTLTLCAVYAPVALASGETGKYLKEFSITLAGAVLLSGFVALTLSPMMCSRTLKEERTDIGTKENIISKIMDKIDITTRLKHLEKLYETMLQNALTNRRKVLLTSALISSMGYFIYSFMPSEQKPYQDVGMFSFEGHAPQTSTLKYTQKYVDEIDKVISKFPEIESRQYIITNPTFEGVAIIKDRCPIPTEQIMREVAKMSDEVSGIDVRYTAGRGGNDDGSQYVYFVVRGNKSHRELKELSDNLVNEILSSGIAKSVRTVNRNDAIDYTLAVNRDKAAQLNIDPKNIANTMSGLMQGKVATKFTRENKLHDVMVEITDEGKKTPDQLTDIYVKAYSDREEFLVPIAELINVYARTGPVTIYRYNRTRSNTLVPELKQSVSLREAIDVIKEIGAKTLPEDVFIDFIDETKRFLHESNTMALIFLLALSFIYLVMAAQFESWKYPLIIMFTVPLALVGGIITLSCIGGTINMFSNIGFLTLIGLITKHGILIVDFANKLAATGQSRAEAIINAAKMRLRPIMMTTAAMVLGSVPLAFAKGAGCEIRIPLGSVIVGGMIVGTIFTLFIVPVVYTYVSNWNFSSIKKKLTHA